MARIINKSRSLELEILGMEVGDSDTMTLS